MTPHEFRDTLNRYYLPNFPDTRDWARRLPQDTKDLWSIQFERIEVEDLRAAIEQVVSGQEVIAAYDRERTAAILKVLALRCQYKREQRAENERLRAVGRQRPMGVDGIMRHIGAHDDYKEILLLIEERCSNEGVADRDYERRQQIGQEVRDQFWAERSIDIQAIRVQFK